MAAAAALRLSHSLRNSLFAPTLRTNKSSNLLFCKFSTVNKILQPNDPNKLILDVKEKLEKDHHRLPVGKNGRDDEDMILWFLKDRKFDVEAAVAKLSKAIKWRQEFGVSELSEESFKRIAGTGKAYIHENLDVNGRPVLIVVASKHFPAKEDPIENQKFCAFLIEKALKRLPNEEGEILGIFDLRGFGIENADLEFLKFMAIGTSPLCGCSLCVPASLAASQAFAKIICFTGEILLRGHCSEGIFYRSNSSNNF
ncbi:hypothetical protein AQUCO_00200054v1 [Aquilegia coerulea]|uniref:CRAL-TRIO domain-containing protein n=1 Tax=Aquilegia coerulea TaxID=218851 RepID=A0A2G5F1D6_AQUCA|nr:hypothetical protein AQUCO_00200054v1 [Aquilegia coerulea]